MPREGSLPIDDIDWSESHTADSKALGNECFLMPPKEGLFKDKLLLGVDAFKLMSIIIECSQIPLCINSLGVD